MPLLGYTTPDGMKLTHEEIASMTPEIKEATFRLPAPVVDLLARDAKPAGSDDALHVSSLADIDNIRQAVLQERCDYYVPLHAQFWAVLGSAVHLALALNASKAERTIEVKTGGLTIVGTIDWDQDPLTDWKFTSAFTGKRLNQAGVNYRNVQKPWWNQLDGYVGLKVLAGEEPPKHRRIVTIFRDWQKGQSYRYKYYPKSPLAIYPGCNTDPDDCAHELKERAAIMHNALKVDESLLPLCQDLWGIDEETRLPKRCLNYCSVSEFCSQFKAAQLQRRSNR
jgi:hypothetical protein